MTRRSIRSIRIAAAGALFVAAWLLWSGHYTPLLLALGAGSCVLVLWLAVRTGFFDRYVYSLYLGPRLPRYWGRLLREIARSNVTVARIVLAPRMPIEPVLVTVDASALSPVAQTMVVNSITLTPGTASLNVEAGRVEVHCLDRRIAEELRNGDVVARAAALSGEA
jgi:multicomponent Na+:H+ antiporter subunit E